MASETAVTQTALVPVIEHVDPSLAGTCAAPVTEYASFSPTAAYAAPTPVSEHVAPAPCAAPAPVTEYVAPAPADAYATHRVIESVAPSPACATRAEVTSEISGADGGGDVDLPAEQLVGWNGAQVLSQPVMETVVPESTDVTERC